MKTPQELKLPRKFKSWRPEGWKNPYGSTKFNGHPQLDADLAYKAGKARAFEAGADALQGNMYSKERERRMRLKEIVAEWLYYTDANRTPLYSFDKQDSNVRDFYFKVASDKLPHLIGGYLSSKGYLTKCIRGCIKDFINAHGIVLTKENSESLVKRIRSRILTTK